MHGAHYHAQDSDGVESLAEQTARLGLGGQDSGDGFHRCETCGCAVDRRRRFEALLRQYATSAGRVGTRRTRKEFERVDTDDENSQDSVSSTDELLSFLQDQEPERKAMRTEDAASDVSAKPVPPRNDGDAQMADADTGFEPVVHAAAERVPEFRCVYCDDVRSKQAVSFRQLMAEYASLVNASLGDTARVIEASTSLVDAMVRVLAGYAQANAHDVGGTRDQQLIDGCKRVVTMLHAVRVAIVPRRDVTAAQRTALHRAVAECCEAAVVGAV